MDECGKFLPTVAIDSELKQAIVVYDVSTLKFTFKPGSVHADYI